MAGLLNSIYATIVRRNYTFLGATFIGAFATELAFETSANKLWDQINKGRQWKDIKYQYLDQGGDDE